MADWGTCPEAEVGVTAGCVGSAAVGVGCECGHAAGVVGSGRDEQDARRGGESSVEVV